ncbi:hypothetical protein C9374_000110 [Naegleria lovaniensis]|uniref:PH domain-containing protein n=1 Tax=Naegleria lovaniensis TaxID=51637 RepID=A0AA88GZ54_NAELO|nr:uncharacterized protein C9374_000110 [Naegleria lovaniensis]KAG2388671.1 hypothetical protein C9374_000110 [Naegleria lovaniensis]
MMQSKTGHHDSLQYVGHSGKAYMLVEKKSSTLLNDHQGSSSTNTAQHQMVKCSIRLKEGKSLLVKKQSEHTLTFKITPFTCAKYTVLSSGVQRVLVSVVELSVSDSSTSSATSPPSAASSAKQSYFVPELQFIFGSEEESKEWCDKIMNNVYCLCAELVTTKIQKDIQTRAVSPTQDVVPKMKTSVMEGYLIRKNQKHHIKTYQKPSVIFAELSNKQLLFYTSHKKSKVADVIGCRVDFTRERYFVEHLKIGSTTAQKSNFHPLAFTLDVTNEQEPRESFACPSITEAQKWTSSLGTPSSPELTVKTDGFDHHLESEGDEKDEEKLSDGGGDEDNGEEIDEELAMLLGLGCDSGTVVIHQDVPTKEDVVGDAVLETGEPDIFGKGKKGNVFGDSFWKPLPASATTPKEDTKTPPKSKLSETEMLKRRVAELEKLLEEKTRECESLKQQLNLQQNANVC